MNEAHFRSPEGYIPNDRVIRESSISLADGGRQLTRYQPPEGSVSDTILHRRISSATSFFKTNPDFPARVVNKLFDRISSDGSIFIEYMFMTDPNHQGNIPYTQVIHDSKTISQSGRASEVYFHKPLLDLIKQTTFDQIKNISTFEAKEWTTLQRAVAMEGNQEPEIKYDGAAPLVYNNIKIPPGAIWFYDIEKVIDEYKASGLTKLTGAGALSSVIRLLRFIPQEFYGGVRVTKTGHTAHYFTATGIEVLLQDNNQLKKMRGLGPVKRDLFLKALGKLVLERESH